MRNLLPLLLSEVFGPQILEGWRTLTLKENVAEALNPRLQRRIGVAIVIEGEAVPAVPFARGILLGRHGEVEELTGILLAPGIGHGKVIDVAHGFRREDSRCEVSGLVD